MHCGSMTCAENRFRVQPRPKGPHGSRCAFDSPHLARVSRVQSLARFKLGEPVRRGPMTSVRWLSVAITWECLSSSSLMRSMGSDLALGVSDLAWALEASFLAGLAADFSALLAAG